MTTDRVRVWIAEQPDLYHGIFVGGTLPWKLGTSASWVAFAHELGMCELPDLGAAEDIERTKLHDDAYRRRKAQRPSSVRWRSSAGVKGSPGYDAGGCMGQPGSTRRRTSGKRPYPSTMSTTTKLSMKPPTLADLDALPSGIVGEIIEGVLYTMTKPRARHQRTGLGIGADLRSPFDMGRGGPGGWWIITEPGIELPNETKEISPDIAGWRKERMPELPADESILVVPDWTCEILSKATRRHDTNVKLPYYAKVGVAYHWMVDIEARVLTAYRLESSDWRIIGTYSSETEARIPPFDAVPLNVASWWLPAAPKSSR